MGKKFIITFAGDTSLGEWYIQRSERKALLQRLKDYPESFFKEIETIINDSDYLILNLETVLADNPNIYFQDKKYPNSDKAEHLLKLLKSIRVTAVSLANNHTMDFGHIIMLQTKELLKENKIQTFGAGINLEEAEQPYKITLIGEQSKKNIYIIGGMNSSKRYQDKYNFFASDESPGINSLNLNRIHKLIKKIRSEDPDSLIIMFLHWQGIDYQFASENINIRTTCSKLIKYGANYIIGHGPHILNEFEVCQSGTIVYSIGNFIFNSKGRYKKLEALPYSAIAKLHFEENEYDWNIELRFYPIVTDNKITNFQSRPINENEYRNLQKMLSEENVTNLSKDSIGFYFSTNRDNSELSVSFQDQKTDGFIINNIILQKPNEYKNEIFSTSNLLATEFEKRGYSSTRIGKYLVVNLEKENVVFLETESSYTSLVGSRLVKDKTMTKIFLKIAGLNVMKGMSFSTKEKEKAYNYAMSLPASVIKPADGNKSRGVTVGVNNREEFENAWSNAVSVTNSKIIVEEQFIGGTEARYLVVGGHCVAVFSCISPNIIGNGINTIEELINIKNKIRLKNPHLKNRLIKINKYRLSVISSQGYELSSIPDNGVTVTIDWKSAVATGGDSIDITDETHILYKKLAEKAVNSIPGLDIAGVDIIAYNHFQEPQPNNYTIVEINTRPGIGGHHYPLYGKPRNVAGLIADYCTNRALKERNESNDN